MVLNFQTFQSSFSQNLPPLQFKDTVSLHAGYQKKWTGFVLRGGYAFVPTPTQDLSGEINFADSDKHEITLGAGFLEIEKWLGIKSQLDIAVGVHSLVQRQVVKNSASSLGYPGYKIGGAVWNYGVSLTTEL
jgi:long-subunit fatty acid transport protein